MTLVWYSRQITPSSVRTTLSFDVGKESSLPYHAAPFSAPRAHICICTHVYFDEQRHNELASIQKYRCASFWISVDLPWHFIHCHVPVRTAVSLSQFQSHFTIERSTKPIFVPSAFSKRKMFSNLCNWWYVDWTRCFCRGLMDNLKTIFVNQQVQHDFAHLPRLIKKQQIRHTACVQLNMKPEITNVSSEARIFGYSA